MPTANLTIQRAVEPTSELPRFGIEDPSDEHAYRRYSPSGSGYETTVELTSRIVRSEPSTVQNVWQWELGHSYGELGAALSELNALDEDDEWKIDTSVYNAASYVAAQLQLGLVRVPQVFVHGPTSVVFNWSDNFYNFYLTVGANSVSALLSSPDRIMRRIEYSGNEWSNAVQLLPAIQSALLGGPVISSNRSTSDLPDFFG